jgi:hypothetical protein
MDQYLTDQHLDQTENQWDHLQEKHQTQTVVLDQDLTDLLQEICLQAVTWEEWLQDQMKKVTMLV